MISRRSPTASRTAATTPIPSSARSGAIRILTARNPSLEQRMGVLGALLRSRAARPSDAYAGTASSAPPSSVATGWPHGLAEQIP